MTTIKPPTELEQLVMLSVLALRDEAYAARVRRDLQQATGRERTAATIHVTLVRLEERGLVTSSTSEPTAVRGGRSTRIFHVTLAGMRTLEASRRAFEHLWSRVEGDLAEG